MDELRFVRREDLSLIVADDAGEEHRLVVDDAVLSELRHLSRRERDASKVRPREIQALIRAGKSRAQVAEATGLEEADIERYEEPVLAERRYILERAHAVPVRTDAEADEDQRFGAVIAERLIALGADTSEWSSWKDEETGWMISLEFISHDVAHQAIWAFEHRKSALSPVNSDAVSLSKQGDVGDRLIPKLRAVDNASETGRFDSGAFDTSQLPIQRGDAGDPAAVDSAPVASPEAEPEVQAEPVDPQAEYARRREIDQRAIKTVEHEPEDLSQTADLLDALRKRRGERDRSRGAQQTTAASETDAVTGSPAAAGEASEAAPPDPDAGPPEASTPAAPRSIWQGAGVSRERSVEAAPAPPAPVAAAPEPGDAERGQAAPSPERAAKKGRASIPSWDDILFGTRSDEDPA
ncbi:septation protein SepH [Leucobacter allii]|uniref:Septation protein SepH n=1 Tax=Leucobacter allii TaxID=2932247 RepID=A0ABY4FQS0_9MICO|nr:septation protein SepH [Leucobacter allii]UOQ58618.1 septation protein SepH [Leucobacter allii]